MQIDLSYSNYNDLNFDVFKYSALLKISPEQFYENCEIRVSKYGTYRLKFTTEKRCLPK